MQRLRLWLALVAFLGATAGAAAAPAGAALAAQPIYQCTSGVNPVWYGPPNAVHTMEKQGYTCSRYS